jgi:hypothetical protein
MQRSEAMCSIIEGEKGGNEYGSQEPTSVDGTENTLTEYKSAGRRTA